MHALFICNFLHYVLILCIFLTVLTLFPAVAF